MDLIYNGNTSAYFNLASEECLADGSGSDVIMLWRNDPAVIIGKNQNAYEEINMEYAHANSIKIVRRLTGGGAVYHDLGNVNYTFITAADAEKTLNFAYFAEPVIAALSELGVTAELSGRNDLTAGSLKFSGTAQCVYNGRCGSRIIHHGTLLFDSRLSELPRVLTADPEKVRSKNVKSVAGRVTNIRPLLQSDTETEGFILCLEKYFERLHGGAFRGLTETEKNSAERLAKEKYSREEYNLRAPIKYGFSKKKYYPFGLVQVSFDVKDGKIENFTVCGDFFSTRDIAGLESMFEGADHTVSRVSDILRRAELSAYICGCSAEDLLALII